MRMATDLADRHKAYPRTAFTLLRTQLGVG